MTKAKLVVDNRDEPADPDNETMLSTTYVNGSRALAYDGENVTASPIALAQLAYSSRVAANVAEYLRAQRVRATLLRNGTVLIQGTAGSRPGFSNYSEAALIVPNGTILRLDAKFANDGRSATIGFQLERGTTFDPPA